MNCVRIRSGWAIIGLVLLAITGCGHGSKVQSGKIEVYYTAGATQAEAERLGAYLNKTWGATSGPSSVQLKKAGDGYEFRLVVKKEFQKDEKILSALAIDGARISQDVFGGANVEVTACDEHFNTLKAIAPRADLRKRLVDGPVEVYYATDADQESAKRLAQYLVKTLQVQKNASGPQATFKFAKRDGVIEVHMVAQKGLLDDPTFIPALRKDRDDIRAKVFPESKVEIHLCDEYLNVLQTVK